MRNEMGGKGSMSSAKTAAADKHGRPDGSGDRLKRLRLLNRFLWLCWLGLPASFAWTYWRVTVLIPAAASSEPGGAHCLHMMGHPEYISPVGKVLFWASFAFQISIFFIALAVLHRMVRKFISGQIFVEDTLAGLKSLGYILIVWPFLMAAVRYGEDAALRALGDLPPHWPLPINVNLGVAAMGLFLLALKAVIEHAIEIKYEQDLTI
jgi:hypothetical protein